MLPAYFFLNFLIYLWLCWDFVSVRGLSLVAASGGHSSLRCVGLSLSRPLLLRSTGSRRAGSVVVAHGPSCSAACGIFPDQGSNPYPLHWQADSQPLRHQGSPNSLLLYSGGAHCRSGSRGKAKKKLSLSVFWSFKRNQLSRIKMPRSDGVGWGRGGQRTWGENICGILNPRGKHYGSWLQGLSGTVCLISAGSP